METAENIKFESLLAQRRHTELKAALLTIAEGLSRKDDKGVVLAIDKQTSKINAFVEAIKSLSIGVDLAPLQKMGSDILKEQSDIKAVLMQLVEQNKIMHEWNFTLNRTSFGIVTDVNAKQVK